MARKLKRKSSKIDYMEIGMEFGGAIAGGAIANQVTTLAENEMLKIDSLKEFAEFAPALPILVGFGLRLFAPKAVHGLALGMASVGGTEIVENFINKPRERNPLIQGIQDFNSQAYDNKIN